MDNKNPFGYPLETYLWVVGVACIAGVIKHINTAKKVTLVKLAIDVLTAGFMGVLTFWVLEAIPIRGPMAAVLIATGGLMGNKAMKEFEALYRARIGGRRGTDPTEDQGEIK